GPRPRRGPRGGVGVLPFAGGRQRRRGSAGGHDARGEAIMMKPMLDPRRAIPIVAAVVLLGALAPRCPPSRGGTDGAVEGGMHGAMPTAEEISLLDKLGTIPDVSKPPPGIDYVLWKEIVPAD